MRGMTLPFAPTKTYGPISVDLKKKRRKEKKKQISLSLSSRSPPLPNMPPAIFFSFYLTFFLTMCPSLIRIRFYPETIYLFLVQFILHELSSSHFPTSDIFVKISSLDSLTTYHSETRKEFRLSHNSTKFF